MTPFFSFELSIRACPLMLFVAMYVILTRLQTNLREIIGQTAIMIVVLVVLAVATVKIIITVALLRSQHIRCP